MAGRQAIGAEIARQREQVGELGPMLHWTHGIGVRPASIVVGEAVDHAVAERAFVVEDIMRDAQPVARPRARRGCRARRSRPAGPTASP